MQKMMTYSEANSVLGSSLTPTNRCLSKAVAIANDADPDLLEGFDNARLVPASVVEPGTHWIDEHTIEHYFVDEDGNNLGTDINITVPKDAAYYIISSKALLDGEPFPSDMMGGPIYADDQHPYDSDWVHNYGNISYLPQDRYTNTNWDVYWSANVRTIGDGTTGHWPKSQDDGVTYFVIRFRDKTGSTSFGTDGKLGLGIDINTDFAQLIKMDYKGSLDLWNIIANFSKDLSTNYYLSKYLITFNRNTPIEECEDTIIIEGFTEGFEVLYVGWHGSTPNFLHKDTDNKFSDVVVTSRTGANTIKITGVSEPEESGIYNIYKVVSYTDPDKFLYFLVVRKN